MEKREFHFSSPDSHIFLGFFSTVFGFVLFFMFFPFFIGEPSFLLPD